MTHLEFIKILSLFIISFFIAASFGSFIISTVCRIFKANFNEAREDLISFSGASIMVGIGSLGYLALLAGLLGKFNIFFLIIITLASLALSYRHSYYLISHLPATIKKTSNYLRSNPFSLLLLLVLAVILVWLYLTAMQPPISSDELSYHLPQANSIVNTQTITPNMGGHYFYGNIPKLMEIIFATAIAFSGYSLAHATHFAFFLSFLLLTMGLIKKYYDFKTSLLASILISLFNDFIWNATVGYVDAASVSLELGALFLTIDWSLSKRKSSLLISAILIGLSLSIKYSAFATLAFIFLIIIFTLLITEKNWFKKTVLNIPIYTSLVILFSGFWYLKNLLLYKNPFYPLYFGHQGVDEATYQSLITAIQQFGPKTIENFLSIPKRYFSLVNLPVFFSLYLAPLSLLIRIGRSFHSRLFLYFLFYIFYWFFIATHQTRFLMPAILVAMILTAIFLRNILKHPTAAIIIVIIGAVITLNIFTSFLKTSILQSTVQWYIVDKIKYGLGMESKSDVLNRNIGCQYSVAEKMQIIGLTGNVIDNWTIWHDSSPNFYSPYNKFIDFTFPEDSSNEEIIKRLKLQGLRYIYFKTNVKSLHLANQDPLDLIYKKGRKESEDYLLQRSSLIYEKDFCRLYQIDFNRLK